MRKTARFAAAMLAAFLLWMPAAQHALARQLPGDFEWITKDGDPHVSRAFFYNEHTLIEFDTYPLFFSVVDDKGNPIPFQREGRYARLTGRQDQFVATIDGKVVEFESTAQRFEKAQKAKAAAAAKAATASKPAPVVAANVAPASPAPASPAMKAGAVVSAPAPAPAPAPVAVAPAQGVYKAVPSDVNVRGVLNRWSRQRGMQEIIWDNGDDIPVDREVPFSADFEQSVADLMATTSYTDHPARACGHSNGVIRVIPRTKFCESR